MADNIINVRIKDRSDTEANWTSKNPVLLKGERAITDGTGKYKIGDGKNTWSALPYYEAMTSADRTKLNGIASGANKTTIDSSLSSSSTNPVQNKVVNSALAGKSNTNHTHDLSTMINTLSIGSSTPTDDDYFVSQYSGGGTTTTTYHRRPVKALLEYIKGKLAKVATSGSYNDLSNKPTIPSVGNGTITIKQAGTVKGSFTTNQSGATTIELTDNNTNTWRGIQNNLTSTATDQSLSAAQGKWLNENKAPITALTDENLNDIKTPGFYSSGGSNTVSNKPTGVDNFGLIVFHTAAGVYYTQILFATGSASSGKSYRRHCYNGTWGDWYEEKLTDTVYTHPSYTAKSSGLYKVTVDTKGHVSATTAVTKADITNLGIPSTNTTYSVGTASALGLTKLYTSTGTSTDGTMTQAALKSALDGKSSTSHTHTKSQISDFPASLKNPYAINIKGAGTTVSSYDGSAVKNLDIVAGTNVTITPDTTNGKITIASKDTNTDTKVTQTAVAESSYTNWRSLVWGASNSGTEGFSPSTVTDGLFSSTSLSVQPSSGTIKAKVFKGSLSGNATSASSATTSSYLKANYIDANTDLNSITTPGFYYNPTNANVQTFKNCPTTNALFMIVGTHAGTYQEITEYVVSNPKKFMRNYYNGTWGSWYRVYTSADVPTKAEIGLGNVDNTSDANKSVKHATSSDTATKLSSSAGSSTNPVYFSGGKPVACSYTLGKSVPSNAVFTDTNTWIAFKGATTSSAGTAGYAPAPAAGAANRYLRCDGTWQVPPDTNTTYSLGNAAYKTVKDITNIGSFGWSSVADGSAHVPTLNTLAFWNGAYNSSGNSNISYTAYGKMGTIVTKNAEDYASASHSHSQYYDAATTRTANTVLAAPNGSNGKASFRKLVAADIPSLTKSKISDFSHTHDDRYYTETEINTKLKNKILPQSTEPTSQSEGDYWLKTTTL